MKKTTTITKEYNEDGKIIKETTIIIEEDNNTTPITIPTTPYQPQSPFNPITPTVPFPTTPWWITTCTCGEDKK